MSKDDTPEGDRIAKVLSRAGIASRRDAERMIAEKRVKVNGKVIESPALKVTPKDVILVDEKRVSEPEPPRLWLFHKPIGLVTTTRDEEGRETVFDILPPDLPRVMTIGRLDLNSEGLLLLTNDGELKRKLELPSTGWLRRYRVRIQGIVKDEDLDKLRMGIEIDGEKFQPMIVQFDRQQGTNAWLTISLREGKNREIRRAMEAIGAVVNRLIRLSYGPFQLGNLEPGKVEEVKRRTLRDQMGWDEDMQPLTEPKKKPVRNRKTKASEVEDKPKKIADAPHRPWPAPGAVAEEAPAPARSELKRGDLKRVKKDSKSDGKPEGKTFTGKTFKSRTAADSDDRKPSGRAPSRSRYDDAPAPRREFGAKPRSSEKAERSGERGADKAPSKTGYKSFSAKPATAERGTESAPARRMTRTTGDSRSAAPARSGKAPSGKGPFGKGPSTKGPSGKGTSGKGPAGKGPKK